MLKGVSYYIKFNEFIGYNISKCLSFNGQLITISFYISPINIQIMSVPIHMTRSYALQDYSRILAAFLMIMKLAHVPRKLWFGCFFTKCVD